MLTLMLALAIGAPDDAGPASLVGRCVYPARMPASTPDETRVACDAAVIAPGRGENDLIIQFTVKRGGAIYGYAGPFDGTTMTIKRLYLSDGSVVAANSGHCRVFRKGPGIGGIACVGRDATHTIVTNFYAK